MMAAKRPWTPLIDFMPAVRGRLTANEPMARYTWFKVGGAAEVFFRPSDEQDLSVFVAQLPPEVPVVVIGNASNLIVRDGGIPGVVIRLGSAFNQISINGTIVTAGAGAADQIISRHARDAGVTGLEFLSGIPGTIGGAVIMNGGAYGSEISDICTSVHCVDRQGNSHDIDSSQLKFSYRHSAIDPAWVVTGVTLRGDAGDVSDITRRMETIQSDRGESQPVKTLTGGSTFANPMGQKAWQLIDQAGCRGLERGDAKVSELHCNFLINTGTATAADLEGLGEDVRRRVFEHSGTNLEWEVRRIGTPIGSNLKEINT